MSVEPEQGEVINGPNLGDSSGGELVQVLATAAQPSPWSTSRSSSSPRPPIPFELPYSSSWRPPEARSSSRSRCGLLWLSLSLHPKTDSCDLTATDSDETSDCVQWCLGFFLCSQLSWSFSPPRFCDRPGPFSRCGRLFLFIFNSCRINLSLPRPRRLRMATVASFTWHA